MASMDSSSSRLSVLLFLPMLLVALQIGPVRAARKVALVVSEENEAAAAAESSTLLLVDTATLAVQPRRALTVQSSGRYRLAKAPRKPPSGPSPTHNGVGTTGTTGRVTVRRITMQRPKEAVRDPGLGSSAWLVTKRRRTAIRDEWVMLGNVATQVPLSSL